jgi:hypothetical protein
MPKDRLSATEIIAECDRTIAELREQIAKLQDSEGDLTMKVSGLSKRAIEKEVAVAEMRRRDELLFASIHREVRAARLALTPPAELPGSAWSADFLRGRMSAALDLLPIDIGGHDGRSF